MQACGKSIDSQITLLTPPIIRTVAILSISSRFIRSLIRAYFSVEESALPILNFLQIIDHKSNPYDVCIRALPWP